MYETKEVLMKKASRHSGDKQSKGMGVMTTNNSKEGSPG
jgi:hypothetical protein